ncbi:MAG: RNA-binding S4 domain-containing protein [Synergistaceae bacterium]|jgi:ribosomal 50S subunit-recycling heat shock protein|nr:RNA-binding S4 domain-containing protein [Synergistaceae bacterium]
MRIDKFLKLSGLVKRRALAREMTDIGAVRLNGRTVKPSVGTKVSDTIEIAFPARVVTAEVISVDERAMKHGEPSVRITGDRRLGRDEHPWAVTEDIERSVQNHE